MNLSQFLALWHQMAPCTKLARKVLKVNMSIESQQASHQAVAWVMLSFDWIVDLERAQQEWETEKAACTTAPLYPPETQVLVLSSQVQVCVPLKVWTSVVKVHEDAFLCETPSGIIYLPSSVVVFLLQVKSKMACSKPGSTWLLRGLPTNKLQPLPTQRGSLGGSTLACISAIVSKLSTIQIFKYIIDYILDGRY